MESSKSPTPSTTTKTCPICLTAITTTANAAVLTTCLHTYCLRCILQWSNYKRNCPLCISPFDSYFSSSSSFRRRHRLPPISPPPPPPTPPSRSVAVQRVIRRTREVFNAANRRSRPVPRLRSFSRVRSGSGDVIQERVIQWRASVYKCGLRAVPFQERNLKLNGLMNSCHREEILRRIEPWIRRELQAVLEDPDPTVIVHVATSLYLSSIEKKPRVPSSCSDEEDTFLSPLRPFLGEMTNKFWHELRCFAESCFNMDTYDEVVEYRNTLNC
ncbi:uncharacterized protein LOC141619165 [Silene latifolia]|uniref:uncharacterized protein LOC141619165 n=1 Tax=Silene latifolia TaxID=37657 RepID=UPI003D77A27A